MSHNFYGSLLGHNYFQIDYIVLQEAQEQIAKEQWKSDFSRVITCFRFTLASPDSSQAKAIGLDLVYA